MSHKDPELTSQLLKRHLGAQVPLLGQLCDDMRVIAGAFLEVGVALLAILDPKEGVDPNEATDAVLEGFKTVARTVRVEMTQVKEGIDSGEVGHQRLDDVLHGAVAQLNEPPGQLQAHRAAQAPKIVVHETEGGPLEEA